ncbi:MAG TPA: glycosyltransferase [Actinomycetota bacterium]|nr:glycosyltransferase [Actinomycetota bacterium]
MRVAWFSPLPPIPAGVSDYSFELLPRIAERTEVHAFSIRPPDQRLRSLLKPKAPAGIPVTSPRPGALVFPPWMLDRGLDGYDAAFYHLGNNPFHRFVYQAARAHPGIAVFHDFVLHHLLEAMLFEDHHGSHREWYRDVLEMDYGALGGQLADLRGRGIATHLEKFVFPLNVHIARSSKALITHSHDVAERLAEVAPDVPITVIPHYALQPPTDVAAVTREEARARLGLPREAFLVGQFGFITKPKQPGAVLGGFARLAQRRPDALLLVVGANHLGFGVLNLIAALGLERRVRLTGFLDLPRFYLYLKACDVVVNLRWPSAGEASGTLARALAVGRAAIVNNVGSFSEVPNDVALKVEVDGDQSEEVGTHLVRLAENPSLRTALEQKAREYASTALDAKRCAELYLEVARQASESKSAAPIPSSA